MVFISRIQAKGFKSFKTLDIALNKNYVCLAGPNGSGKCVDGNTEIYLADGTTAKIKVLVERAISSGSVDEIDEGYIARYDYPNQIFCLDTKSLKIIKKPIAAFVKREAPKRMLKITTKAGKEIIATEYHPLFVLENGEIVPIRADQLKEKTRIATPQLAMLDYPITAKNIDVQGAGVVQLYKHSCILWDAIERVDVIEPREKWVYDLSVSEHHNFIANGIFVHNSNVCDAIRFGLGESRLRTLRAKKVIDLITQAGEKAEVVITFESGNQQMIKRGIRRDGKTLYKLNGKKMTRTMLLDSLLPFGIDMSGHNIIAQGEVQRIVEMNAKQRREIIDRISGIAEFDDKKEEALSELAKVEHKINDANIVLKEREGALGELERDKEGAVKYQDLSDELHRYKGSRIYVNLKQVDQEHTEASEKYLRIRTEMEKIEASVKGIDKKIIELTKRKEELTNEINIKGQKDSAYRDIEALKASISIGENKKSDREANALKLKEKENLLKSEETESEQKVEALKTEVSKIAQEASKVRNLLEKRQDELNGIQRNLNKKGRDFKTVKENFDNVQVEMEGEREKLHALQQEVSNIDLAIELKTKELERVKEEVGVKSGDSGQGLGREIGRAKTEANETEISIKDYERREKELAGIFSDLDKKRVELKELVAVLRAKTSGKGFNEAIAFVLELKDRKVVPGIHGTVGELISFNQEHAVAIEAAVGQRLNYVVVKDVDSASRAIEELKAKKAGRCTFIPLDREANEQVELTKNSGVSGALGYLIDLIKFDKKYLSAMTYAFGDTLLVQDINAARKIGIGRTRMVTLEGDLLESSGILTGGIFRSKIFLADKKETERVEKELATCEEKKGAVLNELEKLRKDLGIGRRAKAELEVKIKGLELELKSNEERENLNESKKQLIGHIVQEIEVKKKEAERKSNAMGLLKRAMEELASKCELLKSEFELVSGSGNESADALEKEINEFIIQENSLKNRIESKNAELALVEKICNEIKQERLNIMKEMKECGNEAMKLKEEIITKTKELKAKEDSAKAISKELEKLFNERNKLDKEVEKLASEKGKVNYNKEKLVKEEGKLEIAKATSETRLTDLKAEYANYESIKPLELPMDELDERIANAEKDLATLGNVNLKAPELYEEKKKDIEDIKEKSEKLEEERKSVIRMIDEIELKKRDIFMQTFKVVNDNFRNLFTHVMKGESMLILEKPEEVFSSGLLMKVKVNSTEKYLESMSGGEKSLLALVFIFAIQMYKPAPFYILDEAEAALDKENSKKLANLLKELAKTTQFIVVTHNDAVLASADLALGVTMTKEGSKVVGINLT